MVVTSYHYTGTKCHNQLISSLYLLDSVDSPFENLSLARNGGTAFNSSTWEEEANIYAFDAQFGIQSSRTELYSETLSH